MLSVLFVEYKADGSWPSPTAEWLLAVGWAGRQAVYLAYEARLSDRPPRVDATLVYRRMPSERLG